MQPSAEIALAAKLIDPTLCHDKRVLHAVLGVARISHHAQAYPINPADKFPVQPLESG
jgi:hypothetical protein